jgi:hypothetical protein
MYADLRSTLLCSCWILFDYSETERSWGIFSYECMLLFRKDEELYNPTEISEQILKNFV